MPPFPLHTSVDDRPVAGPASAPRRRRLGDARPEGDITPLPEWAVRTIVGVFGKREDRSSGHDGQAERVSLRLRSGHSGDGGRNGGGARAGGGFSLASARRRGGSRASAASQPGRRAPAGRHIGAALPECLRARFPLTARATLSLDRARRGASGALYPQSALAGLNPLPRGTGPGVSALCATSMVRSLGDEDP